MNGCSSGERRGVGGYTLIELVTVLAIAGIAAALACPALAGLRRGQDLEAAAVGMEQCLRLAGWRAIVSGRRVRVVSLARPGGGWLLRLEREENAAWVADGDDRQVPRGAVLAVAGPAAKVFNPDGTCSLGSLSLRGADGRSYRCTLAPATGRVRLYRGEREAGRGL